MLIAISRKKSRVELACLEQQSQCDQDKWHIASAASRPFTEGHGEDQFAALDTQFYCKQRSVNSIALRESSHFQIKTTGEMK
jgi:hypothetical protein